MTLREEFEKEVKNSKGGISVLFETSNQHYIEWLEAKIKALSQHDVIQRSEQLPCEHRSYRQGHSPFVPCICNDCGEEL